MTEELGKSECFDKKKGVSGLCLPCRQLDGVRVGLFQLVGRR